MNTKQKELLQKLIIGQIIVLENRYLDGNPDVMIVAQHKIEELERILTLIPHIQLGEGQGYYRQVYETDGTIAAIRAYRNNSGKQLIDAKIQIEQWAQEGNWKRNN